MADEKNAALDGEKVKQMLLARIDLRGLLVTDLLQTVIKPALQKVVDDSKNPIDNVFMAAAYPVIEKQLIDTIDNFLAKLAQKK